MKKNTDIPFFLESVEMASFRLFSGLKASIHPKLTVLVAPNSGGKTAFLDGLCYLFQAFATQQTPQLIEKDTHNYKGTGRGVGCSLLGKFKYSDYFETSYDLASGKGDFEIGLRQNPLGNAIPTTQNFDLTKKLEELDTNSGLSDLLSRGGRRYGSKSAMLIRDEFSARISNDVRLPLPLMAYFTANRRVEYSSKASFNQNFELSKEHAFSSLLPCSGLVSFDEWLRERAINSLEKRLELEESGDFSTPEPDSHLTAVSNVLSKMLSREVDIQNVKYFSSSKSIRAVKEDGTRVSIDELSHGAKSVLTMAAQLAMNCCALNPHYKEDAPAKTPGIILIDEIDLHLHTKWQQHVLDDLQDCFPLMQFIVSTHSPAVLTTVRKENIREIHLDSETGQATLTEPLSRSYGESSGDLQETILGVSARPNNPSVQALNEYLNWAENGVLDEDQSLKRAHLEAEWGADHIDLLTADMIIKRRKLLSEKK